MSKTSLEGSIYSYVPYHRTSINMYPNNTKLEGYSNLTEISPIDIPSNIGKNVSSSYNYISVINEPSIRNPEDHIIDPMYSLNDTEKPKGLIDGAKKDVDSYLLQENIIFRLGLVTSVTFLILAIVISKK